MPAVDLDRGVCQRRHPDGMLIGYYKDSPGVYFDERGEPVSEAVAAAAGHDVRSAKIERVKRQKLDEARRQIEAEVAELEARLTRELEAEPPRGSVDLSDAPEGAYGIVHVGGLYYKVVDSSGTVLSGPKGVLKAEAERLVADLLAPAPRDPDPSVGE